MASLKFAKSHEWVKLDSDTATIGITDYAQQQLGDVVFIELPQIGSKAQQNSQIGTIESTKAASELYSPISGQVTEVNSELVNNPQWVNESPADKGWMVKLKVDNPAELDSLLDEDAYKKFVESESH